MSKKSSTFARSFACEQRIMANEIVLYKPNEQFQLEVQVRDETVWLTQQQMAQLFGVAENNITYHIRGIYKTQELEPTATTQKIRVVRQEGNRTVARSIFLQSGYDYIGGLPRQ